MIYNVLLDLNLVKLDINRKNEVYKKFEICYNILKKYKRNIKEMKYDR